VKFSETLNLIEWCCHVIFSPTSSDFVLGLLSRIMEAASQRFPVKFYKLLNTSPAFWSTCLVRLDRPVVVEICSILLQSPTPSNHSFLWGFFSAIVGDRHSSFRPPSAWTATDLSIRNCQDVQLTGPHYVHLLKLFQIFITSFPDEEAFRGSVFLALPYIARKLTDSDAELCAFFALTSALPIQECVINLALSVLARDPVRPSPVLERALGYVTVNLCVVALRTVVPFLVRAILSGVANNFLFHGIRELVRAVLDLDEIDPLFVAALQHLVAYAWNRKGPNCPILRRVFLIELANLCAASPSFPGWAVFVANVVRIYRARQPVRADFVIAEAEMNPDLVRVLCRPSELEAFVAECLGSGRAKALNQLNRNHSSPVVQLGPVLEKSPKKRGHKRKSVPKKKKCSVA
jgi:hypothetical protein